MLWKNRCAMTDIYICCCMVDSPLHALIWPANAKYSRSAVDSVDDTRDWPNCKPQESESSSKRHRRCIAIVRYATAVQQLCNPPVYNSINEMYGPNAAGAFQRGDDMQQWLHRLTTIERKLQISLANCCQLNRKINRKLSGHFIFCLFFFYYTIGNWVACGFVVLMLFSVGLLLSLSVWTDVDLRGLRRSSGLQCRCRWPSFGNGVLYCQRRQHATMLTGLHTLVFGHTGQKQYHLSAEQIIMHSLFHFM